MAGERQHYIPRFLLKGFASKTSGNKAFIWYFQKGNAPKEVSLRDIALEKNFYGEPGDGSLDAEITEKEKYQASVISRLRENNELSDQDINTLSQFVGEMVARTKHMRNSLVEGSEDLMDMFLRNISDPSKANIILNNPENKEYLLNSDCDSFRNLGIDPKNLEMLKVFSSTAEIVGKLFPTLKTEMGSMLKSAYNNALTRAYKEEQSSLRIEDYKKLYWRVEQYEDRTFILGDIGVIKFNSENGEYTNPIVANKQEEFLLLPIAYNTLLIGGSRKDMPLDFLDSINDGIAELSRDFFVAHQNGEKKKILNEKIGNKSRLFYGEVLNEIEKEHFDQ